MIVFSLGSQTLPYIYRMFTQPSLFTRARLKELLHQPTMKFLLHKNKQLSYV